MWDLALEDLRNAIVAQKITSRSVIEETYRQIERLNPTLNAYRSIYPKHKALEMADSIDQKAKRGQALGRLAGIPVSIKDNICSADGHLQTSCGSKMLEHYHSPYDATVVQALNREDAIIVGKTNMDEFAMGSSSESCAFGVVHNPWNTERVPGGSSGGAAVSIAARMAKLALGSDTGGSIRQPASMCGVTGLKPTYGRVSRYGLVAYGSSLDQIGPLAATAKDCAYALAILQGVDTMDSSSAKKTYPAMSGAKDLQGLRFCIPKEYMDRQAAHPEIIDAVEKTIKLLKQNGAIVEERSLPSTRFIIPVYYLIAFAEASSNLSRYDGIRYGHRAQGEHTTESLILHSRAAGFGKEVKRRIMLGTFILSAGYYDQYFGKATNVRRLIEKEVLDLLQDYDCILGPVCPTPPFKIGEKSSDPLAMYLEDIYTVLPNLSRTPAISIPGPTAGGMPNGIQLIGRPFDDQLLLSIAETLQQLTSYHKEVPDIAKG